MLSSVMEVTVDVVTISPAVVSISGIQTGSSAHITVCMHSEDVSAIC